MHIFVLKTAKPSQCDSVWFWFQKTPERLRAELPCVRGGGPQHGGPSGGGGTGRQRLSPPEGSDGSAGPEALFILLGAPSVASDVLHTHLMGNRQRPPGQEGTESAGPEDAGHTDLHGGTPLHHGGSESAQVFQHLRLAGLRYQIVL